MTQIIILSTLPCDLLLGGKTDAEKAIVDMLVSTVSY